jgi:hypothetical protein
MAGLQNPLTKAQKLLQALENVHKEQVLESSRDKQTEK